MSFIIWKVFIITVHIALGLSGLQWVGRISPQNSPGMGAFLGGTSLITFSVCLCFCFRFFSPCKMVCLNFLSLMGSVLANCFLRNYPFSLFIQIYLQSGLRSTFIYFFFKFSSVSMVSSPFICIFFLFSRLS